jgi:DNA-directed RNA polymerase specialized sigma subunit, sigma24 homolog
MNHYSSRDYALNKNNKGIVYDFADGEQEITVDDFLSANPELTHSDFDKWKAMSNADYLERDRVGCNTSYKDENLDWAAQKGKCSSVSPEDIYILALDELEEKEERNQRIMLAEQALDKLTVIQRRRYLLNIVSDLTAREIAADEGVAFQVVSKSILSAKKKIDKFIAK